MIKVGLTGGIGSGKTLVCEIFSKLNVPVFNSDAVAKNILFEDKGVNDLVKSVFGNAIVNSTGDIDRKKLSSLVFNNEIELNKLNSIIHPLVGERFRAWCDEHADKKYIIKEAAILFESGAYKGLDKIITVSAPLELRIQRTMKRDVISREEVSKRMSKQLLDKEREERSDLVIVNDETQMLVPQVLKIHEQLTDSICKQ